MVLWFLKPCNGSNRRMANNEFGKGYEMMTLKGNLVILEPLDVDKHAKGYFDVCQDENIHRYTGNTVPQTVGEIVALLKKYEDYFLNWMIISNETQNVIGIIRLGKPSMEDGKLVAGESEFLASRYWRKGHMKESKKLFYSYVFDVLSVELLYADVWEGNENSIKSLESSGYKLIETTDGFFTKTGRTMKKYIFTLSKEDYQRRASASAE